MVELKFYITNSPWINNGISRLEHELKTRFNSMVSIHLESDGVMLTSENCEVFDSISESLRYLASDGTYNFSQSFKIINQNIQNANYLPPVDYPKNKNDLKEGQKAKTMEISEEKKQVLLKNNVSTTKKQQQIWKRRLSYLEKDNKSYFKFGLDLVSTQEFSKFKSNKQSKNICPYCGQYSKNMIDVKQYFNPLMGEHHNNEIEGFSTNMRKNNKMCLSCFIASLFSLFDKYIPFYWDSKNTLLALPIIYDLILLGKVVNNLSLKGQYIDFNNPDVTRYNTNIKALSSQNSKSSALLSLLHNIQNKYLKEEPDDLFDGLKSSELMELTDWIFIKKDSFSITRLKANSNVYKILEPQKDPKNGNEVYLLLDFLNKINFKFKPSDAEKFYNAFLIMSHEKISDMLFEITKYDINKINSYNGSKPLYLFKNLFLEKIMGEITMINEELKKSAKNVASTIGRGFYKDIGLMTKFAYSTDELNFKKSIEEASFLMAKKASLDNENFYLNQDDIEVIFDVLNKENFDEFKSYFVSFMSASALYQNYTKNKKGG
jgi:hypothetical protein